jgi:hypothetical protein
MGPLHEIGNVTFCMTRGGNNFDFIRAKGDSFTVNDNPVKSGNARYIGTQDFTARLLLKFFIPLHMIDMIMGVQDSRDFNAFSRHIFQERIGFTRIDDEGL